MNREDPDVDRENDQGEEAALQCRMPFSTDRLKERLVTQPDNFAFGKIVLIGMVLQEGVRGFVQLVVRKRNARRGNLNHVVESDPKRNGKTHQRRETNGQCVDLDERSHRVA